MSKENEEVKEVEVLTPEESNEESPDLITEEELNEETETPAESSSEEKTDDTKEEDEPEEVSETEEDKSIVEQSEEEIKKLPDETPREYALRQEVTRLKRKNREQRKSELLGEIKPVKTSQSDELTEEDKELLSQYDQSELTTFEKVLSAMAKKQGWVKKDEFQATTFKERAEDVLDSFLQEHPEYAPENDKDNVLWGRFREEFSLYKEPSSPKDLKRILNKIHKEIYGIQSEDELKKVNAQKEKIKVASHSGDSSKRGQSSSKESKIDPSLKPYMKGDWSDLDL
jgi:X-linked retinitis pigmentosa GTPase regulator